MVAEEYGDFGEAAKHLDEAVTGLRTAGAQHHVPRGFLARAELHRVTNELGKAKHDIGEALEIAERGQMRLFECDAHLEYERLYLAQGEGAKARPELETAEKMVEEMGYHRRDPEVSLGYAHLLLLEGEKEKAREKLEEAKQQIETMGLHRWDRDAAELEKQLRG